MKTERDVREMCALWGAATMFQLAVAAFNLYRGAEIAAIITALLAAFASYATLRWINRT